MLCVNRDPEDVLRLMAIESAGLWLMAIGRRRRSVGAHPLRQVDPVRHHGVRCRELQRDAKCAHLPPMAVMVLPLGLGQRSADQAIVLGMAPNPKLEDAVCNRNAEGTVMSADTHRPHVIDSLEMKRRMMGVGLEKSE
jgi:hypothetical protein